MSSRAALLQGREQVRRDGEPVDRARVLDLGVVHHTVGAREVRRIDPLLILDVPLAVAGRQIVRILADVQHARAIRIHRDVAAPPSAATCAAAFTCRGLLRCGGGWRLRRVRWRRRVPPGVERRERGGGERGTEQRPVGQWALCHGDLYDTPPGTASPRSHDRERGCTVMSSLLKKAATRDRYSRSGRLDG